MANELTPEQMTGHIAAMRAEPWGEERADYRTAYLAWWMFNLWGSAEDGEKKPEAEVFLNDFRAFVEKRTTEEETVILSPDEAAQQSKGYF
jgi:hypothetical protein